MENKFDNSILIPFYFIFSCNTLSKQKMKTPDQRKGKIKAENFDNYIQETFVFAFLSSLGLNFETMHKLLKTY